MVELGDAGPVPFAAMVLAELGADVVRVERPGAARGGAEWVTLRGRPSIALDLKQEADLAIVRRLSGAADVLMEGFRPGVMERLGVGPKALTAANPRLVFCRATGWGQDGPLARAPGHDLNYLAITGILNALGPPDRPPPVPLNILGDFGGGAMFVLVGVLAALREAERTGRGQVLDCAMSEGASSLASFMHYMRAAGRWSGEREGNLLDGGAPFYGNYACADGKYVAVGAIEPQFFAALRRGCELENDPLFAEQHDRIRWPAARLRLAEVFRTRTRDEWAAALEGTDACVTPILDWDEAPLHPQNVARGAFLVADGVSQPAPALRLSRTPATIRWEERRRAREDVLASWGLGD